MGEGAGVMLAKPNPSGLTLSVPTSNLPAVAVPSSLDESLLRVSADTASLSPGDKVCKAGSDLYSDCKPLSQLIAGGFGSPTVDGDVYFNSYSNNNANGHDTRTSRNDSERSAGNGNWGEHECPPASFSAKYRSMVPSRISMPSQSACFTIPTGFSLSPLLESPILIGGLADASPTTGSFSTALYGGERDNQKLRDINGESNDSFIFKPHPVPYGGLYQNSRSDAPSSQLVSGSMATAASYEPAACPPLTAVKTETHLESYSTVPSTEPLESAAPSQLTAVFNPAPIFRERSSDGYNWKKYGQKQLKGSEYPRSYYKCTYPNCPVKKQVECSHEGEITEIMYKGEHNHPKPQTTRRASRIINHSLERPVMHENTTEVSAAGRLDPDRTSAELSSSSLAVSHAGVTATPEQSFCSPSDEDGEGSKLEDDEEDEQDSKRRRTEDVKDILSREPIRTVREARVVVQTISEVDILDDGYRWRKYGQKVVKGNLYPRSYYKCTNLGCIVRKHVERSSTDPKSVITTYEGKHNHNVPAARGSVQESSAAALNVARPNETASSVALSDTSMISRSMLFEQPDSSVTFGSDRFNRGSQIPVSINTGGSVMDYVSKYGTGMHSGALSLPLGLMGPDFPPLKSFGVTELNRQGTGLTLPQQFYHSGLSSYTEEKPFSRQ